MEERRVDMVRVPREEQIFAREDIFGRDASSVFPTEFRKQQQEDMEAMKEAIGAKKFISETELLEIKANKAGEDDGGDGGPVKPLAEILKERKEAKDAEFQQQWKLMKQGKNKPLDDEDVEFLDANLQAEVERLRRQRQEEQLELLDYRQAVEAQANGQAGEGSSSGAQEAQASEAAARPKPTAPQVLIAKKPALKPVLRAVVKARPKPAAGSEVGNKSEPEAKKPRTEAADPPAADSGQPGSKTVEAADGAADEAVDEGKPALTSLLGDYGSGDEEDSDGYRSD